MYEDTVEYKEAFEYNLRAHLQVRGITLRLLHRENGDTLEEDFFMSNPDLLMVDYDLGETTGDEIITVIDSMPELRRVSIIFYSGGESLETLEGMAKKHQCHIMCHTKEAGELENAVLNLI